MRRTCAGLLAALVAVVAGCGESEGDAGERSGLPPAPPGVVTGCREAARTVSFEAMCPAGWPAGGERVRLRSFGESSRAYLLEAQTGFRERSPVFHVLIGGQERPFRAGYEGDGRELRVTTRLVEEPVYRSTSGGPTGDRFVSERPTRRVRFVDVGGLRGAVLRAPRFPEGGIHGDHSIVMWNEGGHGYLVSAHSHGSPRAATDMAIRLARSFGPVD